jgi:hypothetical protein
MLKVRQKYQNIKMAVNTFNVSFIHEEESDLLLRKNLYLDPECDLSIAGVISLLELFIVTCIDVSF